MNLSIGRLLKIYRLDQVITEWISSKSRDEEIGNLHARYLRVK